MAYVPSFSVTVLRVRPVSRLVTVTVTPGRPAPPASVTCPPTPPVVRLPDCAYMPKAAATHSSATNRLRVILILSSWTISERRILSETLQKSFVARKLLQALEQHLHGGHRVGSGKGTPQRVDLRQVRRRDQLLLFSRAGLGDVHGGEDAPLEQTSIENDLRVAGALELLKDHFIHS